MNHGENAGQRAIDKHDGAEDSSVQVPVGMRLVEEWRLDDLLEMEQRFKAARASASRNPISRWLFDRWDYNPQ